MTTKTVISIQVSKKIFNFKWAFSSRIGCIYTLTVETMQCIIVIDVKTHIAVYVGVIVVVSVYRCDLDSLFATDTQTRLPSPLMCLY